MRALWVCVYILEEEPVLSRSSLITLTRERENCLRRFVEIETKQNRTYRFVGRTNSSYSSLLLAFHSFFGTREVFDAPPSLSFHLQPVYTTEVQDLHSRHIIAKVQVFLSFHRNCLSTVAYIRRRVNLKVSKRKMYVGRRRFLRNR